MRQMNRTESERRDLIHHENLSQKDPSANLSKSVGQIDRDCVKRQPLTVPTVTLTSRQKRMNEPSDFLKDLS